MEDVVVFNSSNLSDTYMNFELCEKYTNASSLLKCFDLKVDSHVGTGSEVVSYKTHYAYPYEVDDGQYLRFLLGSFKQYHFMTNVKFEKAWWVDYPINSYAGLHRHEHHDGREQITTVLFLTTSEPDTVNTHEGFLYTVNGDMYKEHRPVIGDVYGFNGRIWHGTYPTKQPRKAFVCDVSFDYAF